jgi:hypothetical protein
MKTINCVIPNKGMVSISIKEHTQTEPEFSKIDLHLWEAKKLIESLSSAVEKAAKYPEEVKAARIIELEASIKKQAAELSRLKG